MPSKKQARKARWRRKRRMRVRWARQADLWLTQYSNSSSGLREAAERINEMLRQQQRVGP